MHEQGSFDDQRRWVEAMMRAGEPLASVERDIEDAPLGDENKDALWLVAWCLNGRRFGRAQILVNR